MADLKQSAGTLIAVSPLGYYEVHVAYGSNTHSVLLPIEATSLTAVEPVLAPPPGFVVER
jgi:hypothetical protein